MNSVSPSSVSLESAVLVPVPEAELAVGRHRHRLDRAATWGVPAHVTILFPFVAPSAITSATITALADAVGSVTAFDCEFPATAWFGQEVVWLAPQPAEPFRALTRAVSAAFPEYPSYGGGYDDIVPHLTVGYRPAGGGDGTTGSRGGRAAPAARPGAHQPGVAHDRPGSARQLADHCRTAPDHRMIATSNAHRAACEYIRRINVRLALGMVGPGSPVLGQFLACTQRARHVFPLERRHG